MIYKNGIKGRKSQMKTIKLNSIRLNPDNPRLIRDGKFKKLVESIKRDPEFLEKRGIVHADGVILGGNQRYLAIKEALKDDAFRGGLPKGEIPASWVQDASDWPEEKRRRFIILDNTSFGEMDFDILANLFSDLPLVDLGVDLPEDWLVEEKTEPADAEPQIDKAEELNKVWRVKPGDLWQIGEHRLLCGDSTKKEDVGRVMGETLASLTWTDPPYGVKYGKEVDGMPYRKRSIKNDDLPRNEMINLIRGAFKLAAEHSVKGGAIYAAAAAAAGDMLKMAIDSFEDSGFTFKWQLVWVKDSLVLSRADYHFRHENVLYGWKEDGAHFFIDDRKQDSVFEYPRPKKSEEHPMMKPIDLVMHMIKNSSKVGDTVYDPFSGSGCTIISCQNLKRVCRCIELSPDFCAVICQRMTDAFPGIEIKRLP
jgi:DNA modification methylase